MNVAAGFEVHLCRQTRHLYLARGMWLRTYFPIVLIVVLLLSISILNYIPPVLNQVSQATSISIFQNPAYRIVEHPLPTGSSGPLGISSDNLGRIWFVEVQSNQIGMFDPATNSFSEFNVPTTNSLLEQIAVDKFGNVWFTELDSNQLGELKNGTQTILEFMIPRGQQVLPCGPVGITTSSDGNVWITCMFSNQIDEFSPINETYSTFDIPLFHSAPVQIVFDPQGNLWFTAADVDMLGFAVVTHLKNGTSNGIQEFAPVNPTYLTTVTLPQNLPNQSAHSYKQSMIQGVTSISSPTGLAISPDGSTLWITEHTTSSFDRYNIQSKTLIKYWTSQTHNAGYTTSLPNGVAVDNQGYVWIAEHYGNKIAEFNPSTEQLIEYPIPCLQQGIAGTLYLTLGKNSAVWFSEFIGDAIGEIEQVESGLTLSLDIGMSIASIESGGNITLPITLTLAGSEETSSSIDLDISGISATGFLQNLVARFNPSKLTLSHSDAGNSSLMLKANGIGPGIYYLTVNAKLSLTGAIYSTILKLTVQSNSDFRTPPFGGVIIVVASIAVIGSLFLILQKRDKSNSHAKNDETLRLYPSLLT